MSDRTGPVPIRLVNPADEDEDHRDGQADKNTCPVVPEASSRVKNEIMSPSARAGHPPARVVSCSRPSPNGHVWLRQKKNREKKSYMHRVLNIVYL